VSARELVVAAITVLGLGTDVFPGGSCSGEHHPHLPVPSEPADSGVVASTAGDAGDASTTGDVALDAGASLPPVHRVLEVGDSMVGYAAGLAKVMKVRLAAAGIEYHSDAVTSASIATFDESPKLPKLMKLFDPELVIINLGTNTLTVPHPESLGAHAAHIAAQIAPRRCLWLGPPSLHETPPREPSPLIAVLKASVAPCLFFDTSDLVLERQPDGIHPTERGAMKWADAFAPVLAPLLGGGATVGDGGVYSFPAP
jgi:hypothetical protein